MAGSPSPHAAAPPADLARWLFEGAVPEPLCEQMLADPGFPAAVRHLARGMLDAAANDPRVDGIFKDAGRYVVAMIAMLLHGSGGLTLPRLKDFCEQSGQVSRSRARGLLLYLRFLRYVEPAARGAGAPQRFIPTTSFEAAWATQSAVALSAAALIEPDADRVARALGQPAVLAHFARAHVQHLFDSATSWDLPFAPELLHRHAGSHLVWVLLAEGAEGLPPHLPQPVSVAGFARRFGVSRPHVRRLLDGGVDGGVLTRDADGAIGFAEASAPRLRRFYAQQLVALLSSAAATLSACNL
jgi:hypothetical protein